MLCHPPCHRCCMLSAEIENLRRENMRLHSFVEAVAQRLANASDVLSWRALSDDGRKKAKQEEGNTLLCPNKN